MDAEALKTLGTLLMWGALFFLMMRFGCGRHMAGGHGHHGSHGKSDDAPAGQTKDPVCGMSVDPQQSTAACAYRGKTYHFCSTSCRDKFEKDPAKYAGAPAGDEHRQGGSCHG